MATLLHTQTNNVSVLHLQAVSVSRPTTALRRRVRMAASVVTRGVALPVTVYLGSGVLPVPRTSTSVWNALGYVIMVGRVRTSLGITGK